MNPSPALLSLVQKWREGPLKKTQLNLSAGEMRFQCADELSAHLPALAVLVETVKDAEAMADLLQQDRFIEATFAAMKFRQKYPKAALDTKARGDGG